MPTKPRARQWLFDPFTYIAGTPALVIGLLGILIAGGLGSFSNTHFDGVLDVHSGAPASLTVFLLEGIISWLCISTVLSVLGVLVSKSSIRPIDIFGTQALARLPTLIIALAALLPGSSRYTAHLAYELTGIGQAVEVQPTDVVVFGAFTFVALLMIIWMVYLMYKAFAVSCNLSGGKSVWVFIAGLITAEVISKVLILWLVNAI